MEATSRKFHASFDVFSPRWGHADRYDIVFTDEGIQLRQGSNVAVCTFAPDCDPHWTGYRSDPPTSIFNNDGIYPPNVLPLALEWAWEQWSGGEFSESEVRDGLRELFAWIDMTARNKPKSPLFQGAF